MAQTTGGMTFIECEVRASTTGAAPWTTISGHGASIAESGGDRNIGTAHTFDGDTPIVGSGKRNEKDTTVRFIYTETDAEPFEFFRAAYETEGAPMCIEYYPSGGDDATDFYFSTGVGVIKSFRYPQGEAGDGAILMGEVVVTHAYMSKSTGTFS